RYACYCSTTHAASLTTLSLLLTPPMSSIFFFFNDTATTEIYTLSLHDALPISDVHPHFDRRKAENFLAKTTIKHSSKVRELSKRSEEHTSELQSLTNLVCRLLLEKKKKQR